MSDKYKAVMIFAVFAILALAYYSFKQAEIKHFESLVPGAIELSEAVEIGSESHFRGGCAVAIFRLSDATTKRIESEGLHFFVNATHARDYNSHPITYMPWNNTPVPPSWTSEGSWFGCSVTHGEFDLEIVKAGKRDGAYYTTSGDMKLVVIPSLRLAALSFYD